MPKRKKPEYYKAPLRKRDEIVGEIIRLTSQRTYHYDPYWLCFNVKCYTADFSYENMWKHWQESGYAEEGQELAAWQEQAREVYEEHKDHLWDWGVESCRDAMVDSDCYRMLWNGKMLDVEYCFVGRSGGWLAIGEFESHPFDRRMDGDLDTVLTEMPYDELRNLYQLVVQLKHDLCADLIEYEIEHQAAFSLFANMCRDIEIPEPPVPPVISTIASRRRRVLRE